MTPATFRKLALSLEGASEGAHHGHADFRAGGRIFATLDAAETRAMVQLPPEQQEMVMAAEPGRFTPAAGAWGRGGATLVALKELDTATAKSLLAMAYARATAPKPKKARSR